MFFVLLYRTKNESSMFFWLTVTLGLTEVLILEKVVLHKRVIRVNMELAMFDFI